MATLDRVGADGMRRLESDSLMLRQCGARGAFVLVSVRISPLNTPKGQGQWETWIADCGTAHGAVRYIQQEAKCSAGGWEEVN